MRAPAAAVLAALLTATSALEVGLVLPDGIEFPSIPVAPRPNLPNPEHHIAVRLLRHALSCPILSQCWRWTGRWIRNAGFE